MHTKKQVYIDIHPKNVGVHACTPQKGKKMVCNGIYTKSFGVHK
jgi:hypothetical protein